MSPVKISAVEAVDLFTYSLPPELGQLFRKAHKTWSGADFGHEWLDNIDRQLQDVSRFKALGAEVREDGFTHLLVLGGRNSSVLVETYSRILVRKNGCLESLALDSTDTVDVRSIRAHIDLERTLVCVSDNRVELARCFFEEMPPGAGEHFIAIVQPGSDLEAFARDSAFRHIFVGEDGPFSDCGLIPHAAAGYDTEKLLKCAKDSHVDLSLGVLLETAAKQQGRDKVTLIASDSLQPFACWVEQLLQRSTDLIPITGEPMTGPENYGSDRIFVYLRDANDGGEDRLFGQPVVRFSLEHLTDIAPATLAWQAAAAIVGQSAPVESARERALSSESVLASQENLQLLADARNAEAIARPGEAVGGLLRRHLDRLAARDTFSLLSYLPDIPEYQDVFGTIRKQILESKGAATVLRCGPQQGTGSGVCLQITYEGGRSALAEQNCRVLRVHLRGDLSKGLDQLRNLICAAVEH